MTSGATWGHLSSSVAAYSVTSQTIRGKKATTCRQKQCYSHLWGMLEAREGCALSVQSSVTGAEADMRLSGSDPGQGSGASATTSAAAAQREAGEGTPDTFSPMNPYSCSSKGMCMSKSCYPNTCVEERTREGLKPYVTGLYDLPSIILHSDKIPRN